ncbi:MAG: glycosyltransferase family 39 protein [Clostridium sp.]
MKVKSKVLTAILIMTAIISLVIPFCTLFTGEGAFAWQFRQRASIEMLVEIGILMVLLLAAFLLIQDPLKKGFTAAGISLIFCWLHTAFLPMLLSGLYVGYLIIVGRFVRTKIFRVRVPYDFLADFLLGSSLVITEFCVLSALKLGGISNLSMISVIQGVLALGWLVYIQRKTPDSPFSRVWNVDKRSAALFSFIMLMILIQIGKMNITLDFDTLWYGVRSEYILDNGHGIYENPGLVGMAYVYSKGLETLVLPLSNLASHSYLLFFNIWLTVLGLCGVYGIARFYMKKNYALLSAALISAIPGVMNMSISAKPDIITWLLQLIMIFYLLCYVKKAEHVNMKRPVIFLILAAGAYLLSLTMKPTALVFSTAVFGMAGLYLLCTRTLSFKAPLRHWLSLLLPGAALVGIWARTMMITGMPVMSVFTSIFAKLGFQMKYPFATGSLPQNWQDESNIHVLLRRLYQVFLAPEGKDMGHVVIAWSTSLLFFLVVCLLICAVGNMRKKQKKNALILFAHVIFWPFLIVNLVSLVMLYQVDGNYFMLLYTAVVIAACRMFSLVVDDHVKKVCLGLLIPLLGFNILVSAESNWAWALGFSDIKLLNSGRMDHRAMQKENLIAKGNAEIFDTLAANSKNRVIAFGNHPFCLEFPCVVQSYKDITAPWGNAELVNSAQAFEEYMTYAKTDYVYVEAGYIGENSWSWSYDLLKELIRRGTLTNLFFENGNVLAAVDFNQSETNRRDIGEANLQLFMKNYKTAQ